MIRRSSEVLVLCIACLAAPSVVHAEPSSGNVATAKSLVVEGRELRAKGEHTKARDRFKAAWALVPTPIIGLDLARELVACGQLVEGREMALAAAKLPEGAKESTEGKTARAEATKLAAELRDRIPSLVVRVENAESLKGLRVTLDGEELPVAALGVARKVDPGKHVVVAKVGAAERTETVIVSEASTKEVTLKVTPTEGAATKDLSQPTASAEAKPVWPWVTLGVGAVGLVAGGVFAVVWHQRQTALVDGCSPYCTQKDHDDLISNRNSAAIWSTVLLGLGAVGVGVGLWGLTRTPEKSAAQVQLLVGVGSAGVHIAF
ncbi:MAG: hypothetical protein JNL79_27760 [Myxococcales bacterium]|nr:hypothetical protein [Myxococcales bacterium]